MSGARVFPFTHSGLRGPERMRVVVTTEKAVVIERFAGTDALGGERWATFDLTEGDEYEYPLVSADEWVTKAVLAVLGEVDP